MARRPVGAREKRITVVAKITRGTAESSSPRARETDGFDNCAAETPSFLLAVEDRAALDDRADGAEQHRAVLGAVFRPTRRHFAPQHCDGISGAGPHRSGSLGRA